MIFLPRFPRHPPHGRIDNVIYFGAGVGVASYGFYFVDFLTGDVGFLPAADLPGSPPAGPAGGDLGGTYPDPTLDNCPDAALSGNVPIMTAGVLPAVNGSLLTNLPGPSGSAAGDLGGTYPNPTVISLAHVTTGPVTYPAGSGALLTGIPPPASLSSGSGSLDGSGNLSISPPGGPAVVVTSWIAGSAGVGQLGAINTGSWVISSSAGAADSGKSVFWIAY